jgi:hypothetical protein
MTTAQPFVVRVDKPRVTVTYNCPTAEWALRKLSEFQAAGHANIIITGPDGQPLAEADLFAMVNRAVDSAPEPGADRAVTKPQGTKSVVPLREVSAA